MSHGGGGDDEDGKLDLVPLIDTVMLLLMFFILTSKFSADEKAISSLLPTDKGQMASTPSKPISEPKQVNICIYPKGMGRGFQPSEYRKMLNDMRKPGENVDLATLRVGADMMEVDGRVLSRSQRKEEVDKALGEVHELIRSALEKYETGAGERKDQHPIIIHCFSGMSWRFALAAYDAARAYEAKKATFQFSGNIDELNRMREVTFAPPRIRNYSSNEQGNELFEIIHMK